MVKPMFRPGRLHAAILMAILICGALRAATLPALNSNWKYKLGTAEASTPDTTAWRQVAFNDSTWSIGPAPFRYNTGSGGTDMSASPISPAMSNNYTCIFLRQSFTLTAADIAAIPELMLNIDYNDGFIVWINGVQVANVHDPDVVAYNSLASELHTAGVPELIGLPNPSGYLVVGANVMAVQAFNVSKGSSSANYAPDDFLINAELQVSSGPVADTVFSSTRGFYSAPFNLTISSATPGASIRYTTDGTKPSPTVGTLYTAPIPVSATTAVRAMAYAPGMLPTNVDTHTYIFITSVKTQVRPITPVYPTTWLDRGNNSSTAGDYRMNPAIVNNTGGLNPTYTVDQSLTALPSLSITLDPNDWMSSTIGIYPNANESSSQWERACSFELIYPDGTDGFHYNCSTSMAGAASRVQANNAKHSYRMHFKSDWGDAKLDYPILGTANGAASSFDTVELRGTYNNSWTHSSSTQRTTAQYAMVEFTRQCELAEGRPGTHGAFYHLYCNGLYWGVYNAEELPDANFASTYLGGDSTDWDSVNAGTVKDGDAVAYNALFAISNSFPTAPGATQNTSYQNIKQYLDIDNLIDYIIVNCYVGNTDWDSGHNWYGIRRRQTGAGYMFICWDSEHTLESTTTNVVGTNNSGGPTSIFQHLRFDPDFRIRFADHVHKLMFKNGVLMPNASATRYVNIINLLDQAVVAESARWGDNRKSFSITNKALTNNVATLTTSAAHGYAVGNIVSVSDVDSAFNGVYTITAVASTTFNYALNSANVTSQAATGTAAVVTPYTRDNSWLTERTSLVGNPPQSPPPAGSYFAVRTANSLAQFRTPPVVSGEDPNSLYPTFEPPDFSVDGTNVTIPNGGLSLTLSNPATNPATGITMYYTLDGSDPRAADSVNGAGGAIQPTAINGGLSATFNINVTTTVSARFLQGTSTWSALHQVTYIGNQNLASFKITEINYHPIPGAGQTEDQVEFLEFKNTGVQALNLTGVKLYGKGTPATLLYSFPTSTIVNPGAFYILVFDQTQFRVRYPLATYPAAVINGVYTNKLDNGGQILSLQDATNTTFYSVKYNDTAPWPTAADGNGYSLVPVDPNINPDPNNAINWRASTNQGGSPGTDDPPPPIFPTVVINEILANSVAPLTDTIELYNAGINSADISGWYLTDDHNTPKKYQIPAGTVLPAGGYISFNESQFNTGTTAFSLSSHGEEVYLYSADAAGNLTGYGDGFSFDASEANVSFGRYQISTGEIQYPAQISNTFGAANSGPRVGPIVISEMMYFPAAGQDEFIELKNITNNPVNLFDPANPANTWKVGGAAFTFPSSVVMPANGLIIATALDPATFRTKYNVPAAVQIFGPYTGNLQDDGETISLQKPDVPYYDSNNVLQVPYVTVDAVKYAAAAPWPVQAAGTGYALERIDCTQYGNDPINWRAGTVLGGTPGRFPIVTWTGAGDGTNWNTDTNWDNAPFASSYTVLNFPNAGASPYTASNNVGALFAVNTINLNASQADIIAGSSIDFQGASASMLQNDGNVFSFSNAINLSADTTFGGAGAGTVSLTGALTGTGALLKSGPHTLIFTGADTRSGVTTVSGGTLQIDGSLDLQTASVTINTNAVLRGIGTINRPISASGSTGAVAPGNTTGVDSTKGTLTALSADFSSGTLSVRASNLAAGVTPQADKLVLTAASGANPPAVVLGGTSTLQLTLDIKNGAYSNQYTPLLQTTSGTLITTKFASVVCKNFPSTVIGGSGNPQPVSVVYLASGLEVDPTLIPADTVALKLNAAVTPATLDGFAARAAGAGVLLSWTALSEYQNAGFNVYRRVCSPAFRGKDADEALPPKGGTTNGWTRVNAALIAGRITIADPKTYTLYDWPVPGTYEYKLESISLHGEKETQCNAETVIVDAAQVAQCDGEGFNAAAQYALATAQIRRGAELCAASGAAHVSKRPLDNAAETEAVGDKPSGLRTQFDVAQLYLPTPLMNAHGEIFSTASVRNLTADAMSAGTRSFAERNAATQIATLAPRWFSASPSGGGSFTGVKVVYDAPGVLLIPRASLPAGFDANHVAIQREGAAINALALTSNGIVIYAPGYQDDYTDKDALFLRSTSVPTSAGKIARAQGLFANTPAVNTNSPATVTTNYHDVYFDFSELRPYNYPPWFSSQYLTSGSTQDFTLNVPNSSAGAASLTVNLWSLTQADGVAPDHALQAFVNGQPLGQAVWSGGDKMLALSFQVDSSTLVDGANQITLVTPALDGVETQIALLHSLTLSYTRALDGSKPLDIYSAGLAPKLFELSNVPSADVWVVDARFPARAALVPFETQAQADGSFKLRFVAPAGGSAHFLVVPAGQENAPLSVSKRSVKPLRPCAYIAAGPSQFGAGVQPLLALRSKEGLRASFVDQEQLFDYYNYGRYGPSAIQNAVRSVRPRYLLLLGRTTYDYLNYGGQNVDPLCPAFLVSTTFWSQATSDSLFGDLGQGVPQIAVGRLPINTPAELNGAVQRIVSYPGIPPSAVRVHAVADRVDPSVADFAAQADGIAQANPELSWQRNYLDETAASAPEVTAAMTIAANGGADVIVYVGHGNAVRLGNEVPRILDTDSVQNWKGNVVFLQSTCTANWMAMNETGYRSIAIQALTQPQGGISASIGTSTYMNSDAATEFMSQLLRNASAGGVRWGDALLKTQQWAQGNAARSPFYADLSSTEQIFGDPAMPVMTRTAGKP
ncbi:MAG TPA: C25 family cysteine peptidase [Planctomycetota bacterium]|nr:C25 family cysteine peptidase [Planctomycetota bacterium]